MSSWNWRTRELTTYKGHKIDVTEHVYDDGTVSRWSKEYTVHGPDGDVKFSSLENAKGYIRTDLSESKDRAYLVNYCIGNARRPCNKIVYAPTAKDAIEKLKEPYYMTRSNSHNRYPYPFWANAHRIPDGMTEEEALEKARFYRNLNGEKFPF